MKRIKAINGYTIYQATTQRDADNYRCQIGDYSIYLSSDIRDFGLSCSYPEWDGVDSLAVVVAMCNGSKHAVAVELAEELSNSTIQDMDLVLEIERRLDAGESLESVRDSYDTDEQCFAPEAEQYCAVDQETGVPAYTWASSPAEAAADVFAGHDWRMIDLYKVHPVADMFLGEFARPEANDEPDEDLLDGDLEDVFNAAMDEAALRDWELSAIEIGDYLIDGDGESIMRVAGISSSDGEYVFRCELSMGATVDVTAQEASRCKVVCNDSDWEDQRHAAELWTRLRIDGRPAGHATYYVVESDGDYITATVNFSPACYESRKEYQRRRALAFFRAVAERYAFSDCSDDRMLEIVYDGCRIEYAGWQPGMLYEFREMSTGLVVFSESFPEWDH